MRISFTNLDSIPCRSHEIASEYHITWPRQCLPYATLKNGSDLDLQDQDHTKNGSSRSRSCPCLSIMQIVLDLRSRPTAESCNAAIRDVEAVKFLMLPLPAPLEVLCFRLRFRFQSLSSKCFRFHIPAQYETVNCI